MLSMTHRTRVVAGLVLLGGIGAVAAGCGQSTKPISSATAPPKAHHTKQSSTQPSTSATTAGSSSTQPSGPTPFTGVAVAATAQTPTIGSTLTISSQKPMPAPANMTWLVVPVSVKNPGSSAVTVTSLNFGVTTGTATYASIAALDGAFGGIFTTKDVSGSGQSQVATTTLGAKQQAQGKLVFLLPSKIAQQSLSLVLGGQKVAIPHA